MEDIGKWCVFVVAVFLLLAALCGLVGFVLDELKR